MLMLMLMLMLKLMLMCLNIKKVQLDVLLVVRLSLPSILKHLHLTNEQQQKYVKVLHLGPVSPISDETKQFRKQFIF